MATANQIIALLKSHVDGDDQQLYSIALQVAAAEAKRGRDSIAQELRTLVDSGRKARPSRSRAATSIAKPRGELADLMVVSHPKMRISDMVLSDSTELRLKNLLHQQRQRDRLRHHGHNPLKNLLLIGPPGSGKTMTSAALAGELHLPLFTIRLDTLITRFLGETATKMRLVFDQIADQRGIYLFDEFDALGARRDRDDDVGEMRRVLNSFLQFIEEPNSTDSIVIATTNHPQLLDRALLRRFDDVIEYTLPDEAELQRLLKAQLKHTKTKISGWKRIVQAAAGLSQGELASATSEVIKDSILNDTGPITSTSLLSALENRQAMQRRLKDC